ncbi:MAG TPA: outer membrane beta-barrel protein [Candidatus Krumholzibacterium sp.]|nr:outer membrane beta-barrel protein [Candidatus Krumholzibacterium sp.]
MKKVLRVKETILTGIMLLLFATVTTGASAREVMEDESGLYLGVRFIGSSLNVDEDDEQFIEDEGGGLMLDFGWRFNPVFALEFSIGGSVHETVYSTVDADFGTAQIMAVYRFLPDRPFRPFIKGGFGGYGFEVENGHGVKYRIEGGGIAFGGGFKYFITEHFAMGMDLTHSIINYDTETIEFADISIEGEIDEDGSHTSLGFSLSYSF